ncbi:RNA-directed DNA polymerase from mobile element jockey [Anthophora plagiata]
MAYHCIGYREAKDILASMNSEGAHQIHLGSSPQIRLDKPNFPTLVPLSMEAEHKGKHFTTRNHNIIRKDRTGQRSGGGVALVIHKDIEYVPMNIPGAEHLEGDLMAIETTNLTQNIIVVGCYRPPHEQMNKRKWNDIIEKLNNKGKLVLAGDFNAQHPMWNNNFTNTAGENLEKILADHNLIVHNTDNHSRVDNRHNSKSNIDLFITSTDLAHLVTTRQLDDTHGSDHYPIEAIIEIKKQIQHRISRRLSTIKRDWQQYNREMDNIYGELLNKNYDDLPATQKYEFFSEAMRKAVIRNTPWNKKNMEGQANATPKSNPAPWWDQDCDREIRKRKATLKKWLLTLKTEDWIAHKKQAAQTAKLLKSKKRAAFRTFASKLRYDTNVTHFWNTIRKFKSRWVNTSLKPQRKDNLLEQQAVSKICPPWVPTAPPSNGFSPVNHFLDNPFDFTEFLLAINQSKIASAPGPDKIEIRMLQHLSNKCKLLLLDIYNNLYNDHTIPQDWKKASVFFIPKQNGKGLRPITLASINNRLQYWCENNNLLSHMQSGFRRGRSCMDNIGILTTLADIGFRTNSYTLATFLDIDSAFDNVQRDILLQILKEQHITGNTYSFIAEWMTNRCISFQGSEYLEKQHRNLRTHKGVPQGGVLSPLLFNIYINSIADNIPEGVTVTLYADDIAVIAQNKQLQAAKNDLQRAVNKIRLNLEKIGLQLTAEKTELLSFGKARHSAGQANLTIGSHTVESRTVGKYLGLKIDHRLKFKEHVQTIQIHCNKLLNIIKFLRSTWWGSDPQSLINIYKALIRSKIEYGSMWYFPPDTKSRTILEGIQLEALRLAMGYRRSTPTNVILAETKLTTLKDRTSYLGAKYLLKVISNSSNPFVNILADFCAAYRNQHNGLNPAMDYDRPLVRSINLIEEFTPLLDRLPNLMTNTSEYRAQHKIIFTDGSKSDSFPAVGAACVIPEDKYTKRITIPKQASVFTAECIALEAAIEHIYRNQQCSYVVCTDSLSLVQTLDRQGIKHHTNRHIVNIKNILHKLKEKAPSPEITIMWVPSHKGILGNELADREAKEAAQTMEIEVHNVPYTDIFPLLKQKIGDKTHRELTRQARFKGGSYFRKYHSRSNIHPWFHNKKLPRHITVWTNRVRSNHYNLKASLKRVNIVQDASCNCGSPSEDIDHVLWDCTFTQSHRQEMLQRLGAKGLSPPYTIEKFLKRPNITALRIINEFVIKNNLKL